MNVVQRAGIGAVFWESTIYFCWKITASTRLMVKVFGIGLVIVAAEELGVIRRMYGGDEISVSIYLHVGYALLKLCSFRDIGISQDTVLFSLLHKINC